LAVAYRNHGQSVDSPDGLYHYGDTEWQDVVEGMKFLKERGVQKVILYGFSMGASVALETFERYKEDPQVIGMILDSPLLDPYEVFLLGAKDAGLPLANVLTRGAMLVGSWRAGGINWAGLDQRKIAPDVKIPVLLFGATADTTIPIALVDEFASLLPDVEYHRLEGVEHVESWNHDPVQYETWVKEFLEKVNP
jgi:pimeloyl-ACP methyl ester carboxylesterase